MDEYRKRDSVFPFIHRRRYRRGIRLGSSFPAIAIDEKNRTVMNTLSEPAAFRIDTALADVEEIGRYADAVAAHARGEIPDDRFTAIRLQMGTYGQRQSGVNMMRVKAPGGAL